MALLEGVHHCGGSGELLHAQVWSVGHRNLLLSVNQDVELTAPSTAP